MSVAIRVENLSKRYKLGLTHARSIRELVNRATDRLRRRMSTSPLPLDGRGAGGEGTVRAPGANGQQLSTLNSQPSTLDPQLSTLDPQLSTLDSFWALKDVSFEVQEGEVLGIIGRNGAGKSTLLKILSRITSPTHGRVELFGRVASLLEVGTGFHPELTGRENVYLNGAILGMPRAEIKRQFDEIVAFAEIEKFIDTPVKRYSSGMYVRLAFAVAAHLEPEILIVDEVLAVGDAQFQKKCLGKICDVACEGRTVLFVSHNIVAVKRICPRTLLLQQGQILLNTSTDEAVNRYLFGEKPPSEGSCIFDPSAAPGDGQVKLTAVRLLRPNGSVSASFRIDERFCIEIETQVLRRIPNFHFYVRVTLQDGTILFGSGDWDNNPESAFAISVDPGLYRARCYVPSHLLNKGVYSISVNGQIPQRDYLFNEEGLLDFEIVEQGGAGGVASLLRPGILRPLLKWEVDRLGIP
jgi:lipopolysaccharide transport system ATP-binding protein